jgi:hypothetical protein
MWYPYTLAWIRRLYNFRTLRPHMYSAQEAGRHVRVRMHAHAKLKRRKYSANICADWIESTWGPVKPAGRSR